MGLPTFDPTGDARKRLIEMIQMQGAEAPIDGPMNALEGTTPDEMQRLAQHDMLGDDVKLLKRPLSPQSGGSSGSMSPDEIQMSAPYMTQEDLMALGQMQNAELQPQTGVSPNEIQQYAQQGLLGPDELEILKQPLKGLPSAPQFATTPRQGRPSRR